MEIQGKDPLKIDTQELALQKAQENRREKAEERKKMRESQLIDKNVQTGKSLQTKDTVELSRTGRRQSGRENPTGDNQVEAELVKTRRNRREQQYQQDVNREQEANSQKNGALSRISRERKNARQTVEQAGDETFENRAQASREIRHQEDGQEELDRINRRENGALDLLA